MPHRRSLLAPAALALLTWGASGCGTSTEVTPPAPVAPAAPAAPGEINATEARETLEGGER